MGLGLVLGGMLYCDYIRGPIMNTDANYSGHDNSDRFLEPSSPDAVLHV